MSELSLPKTKLFLRDDRLEKLSADDEVVGSYPLETIQRLRIEETRDWPFPILVVGLFLALAIISKNFLPSPGWSWFVAIIFLGFSGFGTLMIFGHRLVIETADGSVGYAFSDTNEEAEGFVLSVNQMLNRVRDNEPSVANAIDS